MQVPGIECTSTLFLLEYLSPVIVRTPLNSRMYSARTLERGFSRRYGARKLKEREYGNI